MKELTTREILEYAEKIESESFTFYSLAAEAMADAELKKLCHDLAEQEMGHMNNIHSILQTVQNDHPIPLTVDIFDRIITHSAITPSATPREILTIAYQREMNTRHFYATMLSVTDLEPDIVDLFNALLVQEELHAASIKKRLARLA